MSIWEGFFFFSNAAGTMEKYQRLRFFKKTVICEMQDASAKIKLEQLIAKWLEVHLDAE